MAFITQHPVMAGSAFAALTFAGIGAASQFHKDRNEPAGDRLNHTAMAGFRAAGATAIAAGGGYGLYRSRSASSVKSVGSFFKNQYMSTLRQVESDRKLLSPSLGPVRAGLEAYGRNPRLMAAGGAGAGFLIGAAYGHPILGAGIGLGAGLAAKVGIGSISTWNKAGKFPGLRSAGIVSAAALIFMGTQALAPQYQSEASISDTSVDIQPPQASIRDRMHMLNARGDLVLGLNNRRHG